MKIRKKYFILPIIIILCVIPFYFQTQSNKSLLAKAEYSLIRMGSNYQPSTLEIARDLFRSGDQDWGTDYDNSIKELINRSYFIEKVILLPKEITTKQVFKEFEEGKLTHSFIQNHKLHLIGKKEDVDSALKKVHQLIKR